MMLSHYHVPGNHIYSLFFVLCYLLRAVRRTEAHLVIFPFVLSSKALLKSLQQTKLIYIYMNIHAKIFVHVGLYFHSSLFYLYFCVCVRACVCVCARARGRVYCYRSQNVTQ